MSRDRFVTIEEAAEYSGLGHEDLMRSFYRGLAKTQKVDGVLRFDILTLRAVPGADVGSEQRARWLWEDEGFDPGIFESPQPQDSADVAPGAFDWFEEE
jgi:hypothetical protein